MATKKEKQYRDGKVGGYLVGRRHADCDEVDGKQVCGIQAYNRDTGQRIEMESGEVVIRKQSVDDPTLHSFNGKKMTNREILNAINVGRDGKGASLLEDGGEIDGNVPCYLCGNKHAFNGTMMTDYDIFRLMAKGGVITEQEKRARDADLVLMPENIKGTNCGNCQFVKITDEAKQEGYCQHPKVDQPVTARMCCIYWDAPGVQRVAELIKSEKFGMGGSCGCQHMKEGGSTFSEAYIPQDLNLDDRFVPVELQNNVKLPAQYTETELRLIEHFKKAPNSYASLYGVERDQIKNLVDAKIVYTTGLLNTGYMDVFLTDEGRKALFPLRAEAGIALPTFGAPLILKAGGTTTATYYKGPKAQYQNAYEVNRACEELLDSRPAPSTDFSSDEKLFLSYYTGYGGLEKYGAEGPGLLYEYYTPEAIIRKMWGLAYLYGYKGGAVCEPACGIGDFFKFLPDNTKAVGYETNRYSARIAKILYPSVEIKNQYFEEAFIKSRDSIKSKVQSLEKFDLVIGNPPYGNFQGKYAGMGEKPYTRATNYIDYFIFRGLDICQTGGLLIFIIGAEVQAGGVPFLDRQINPITKEIAQKARLLVAYRLPNGVFERTDVLPDIIVLQKK